MQLFVCLYFSLSNGSFPNIWFSPSTTIKIPELLFFIFIIRAPQNKIINVFSARLHRINRSRHLLYLIILNFVFFNCIFFLLLCNITVTVLLSHIFFSSSNIASNIYKFKTFPSLLPFTGIPVNKGPFYIFLRHGL